MKAKAENKNKSRPPTNQKNKLQASHRIWGDGEMAHRIRSFDWSTTSLGPVATWPQSLCFSVNMMLQSPASLVVLWGEEGITLYNDAYISFAGNKHPSLLGSRYEKSWSEAADFIRNIIDQCLQGESLSYSRLHYIINRNNKPEPIWKDLQCSPIPDEKGKPAGVLLISAETTKAVQAENALKKSEERFRLILEGTNEGVWDLDLASGTAFWNDRLYEILGYTKEEVGKPGPDFLHTIIHPDDLERVLAAFNEAILNKSHSDVEYRVKHKQGHYISLHSKGKPIYDTKGALIRFAGITLDVSERKKSEEILTGKEERLSGIFNQTSVGIAETDLNGRFVLANEQFCKIVGRSQEELYQLGLQDVTHAGDLAENFWRFERVIKEGIPATIEKRFIRPDGAEVWVKNNISLVRDAQCRPMYVLAVSQDITERKQAEKEKSQLLTQTQALNKELEISQHKLLKKNDNLKKANDQLDSFVYRISHDLRAPLASVLGLINVCRLDNNENKIDLYLDLMQKSVSRLDNFIHDVINFSKNNRLEVSLQEIDVSSLLAESLEGLEYMDGFGHMDIQSEIHQEAPFYSDVFRLKVICNNLLSNAIKYRKAQVDQSRIKVTIHIGKANTLWEFKDNGQGIAPDKLSLIFGMFYRASATSKGSGLGLYIVQEVVQTLKGSIQVQSELGEGTTFTVTIPNRTSGAKGQKQN